MLVMMFQLQVDGWVYHLAISSGRIPYLKKVVTLSMVSVRNASSLLILIITNPLALQITNWSQQLTVVTPAVQNMYKRSRSRKCIQGHIPMHAIFAAFIYIFIPVLSRSYFTSRTPDKDQEIEQLIYSLLIKSYNPETSMSSAVNIFLCMLWSPIAWRKERAL